MRSKHLLPGLLIAAALLGAGCGGDGDDDGGNGGGATSPPAQTSEPAGTGATERTAPPAADGAQVFASQACGSCHTLAAADAGGVTGPNLDDLQPSVEQVREQVTNGGSGMPAYDGELSEAEIDAVAVYVSENAGS